MSRTIRTVNRPYEEITVSDAEYEYLLDAGFVYDGTPPDPVADPFDTRLIERLAPGREFGNALRGAFVPRDEYVPGEGGGAGAASGPTVNTADSPLAKAYAGFARRNDQPVIIATNGSSIAASAGDFSIFGQIISGLQRRFPRYNGSLGPTPNIVLYNEVGDAWQPPASNGLMCVNFSTGGANADSQWNSTKMAKAASLNPALHIWCIGINDSFASNGTTPILTPAQHKAVLKADIEWFLANQATAPAFALVHGYQRPDNNVPSTWEAYGDVYRELAAEFPEHVVAIDTSPAFIRAGVPGLDPYGLVSADKLHPSIAGNSVVADAVLGALDYRVPLNAPATSIKLGISYTVAPTVSGTPTVGQTLTVSGGTWFPTTGLTRAYQWVRDGVAIAGATADSYTLVSADSGKTIKARVTVNVSDTRYRDTAYTTAGQVVGAGGGSDPAIVNNTAPAITGTPTVGQTLSVSNGTWTPSSGLSYAYQWLRNGVSIAGATASTYLLVAADAGTSVSARVTASAAGFTSTAATSAPVSAVAAGGAANVWASDSFTTPGTSAVELHNRVTDNALGGTTRTWKVVGNSAGVWAAQDGLLISAGAVSNTETYLDATAPVDLEAEFVWAAIPGGSPGDFSVVLRKATTGSAQIAIKFKVAGFIEIGTNDGTTQAYGSNIAYAPQVGDVVICRVQGATVTVLVNGAVKTTLATGVTAAGRVMLAKDFATTMQLSQLIVRDLTAA